MFDNLTGGVVCLQTVGMAGPALCGLLYEDDGGMAVIDARGQKQWVPWPLVRHFESGAPYLRQWAAAFQVAAGEA